MNVPEIAAATMTFLGPYLQEGGKAAAKKAGESALRQGGALLNLLRSTFAKKSDDYAARTLQRLEEKPADASRQQALHAVLIDEAESDPEFRDQLARFVHTMSQDLAVTQFITNVSGDARVEKLVNIGSAQNVRIE